MSTGSHRNLVRVWSLLSACANALSTGGLARSNEPKADMTRLQRSCIAPSYFYWSLYFGRMFGRCPRLSVPNVDKGCKQISVCLTWLIIRTENTYSDVCYLYRKMRTGIEDHRYEEGLHKTCKLE